MGKKEDTKKMGRPIKVTPKTIDKLEYAFSLGCTDEEACVHADIGVSTLYDFERNNPDFSERKKLLKEKPTFKARKSVVNAIESNPELALKYLERKVKKEFSTRTEQTGADGKDLMPDALNVNFVKSKK